MDYEQAAAYWTSRQDPARAMEREALGARIDAFIAAHNTCALACADMEGFVRCTPLEYNYLNGAFWIFSEGGLKFKALGANENVCLAIYDPYDGFGSLGGLQVAGVARVVEPWSEDYLMLLAHKHIPAEGLRKLPSPLHLVKITPTAFDLLDSSLKAEGLDARQHLDLA